MTRVGKWGRVASATLLAALLLVSQAAYALPAGGGTGSGTSVDGGLISDGGVTILVPFIPPIPTLDTAGAPYQLSFISPVPTPLTEDCFGIAGVSFCVPVPDLSNFIPWVEDTIANAGIGAFNAVSRDGSKALDDVWNVLVDALNAPIDIFDGFTTAFGALLLGGILSIGEPWSVFLVPAIWAVVSIIFGVLLIGMVLGVRALFKALETTVEVAG